MYAENVMDEDKYVAFYNLANMVSTIMRKRSIRIPYVCFTYDVGFRTWMKDIKSGARQRPSEDMSFITANHPLTYDNIVKIIVTSIVWASQTISLTCPRVYKRQKASERMSFFSATLYHSPSDARFLLLSKRGKQTITESFLDSWVLIARRANVW